MVNCKLYADNTFRSWTVESHFSGCDIIWTEQFQPQQHSGVICRMIRVSFMKWLEYTHTYLEEKLRICSVITKYEKCFPLVIRCYCHPRQAVSHSSSGKTLKGGNTQLKRRQIFTILLCDMCNLEMLIHTSSFTIFWIIYWIHRK